LTVCERALSAVDAHQGFRALALACRLLRTRAMRIRLASAFTLLAAAVALPALSSTAEAQVIFAPPPPPRVIINAPPIVVGAPPIYVPAPPRVIVRERWRWVPRPRVVVVSPPVAVAPPPPPAPPPVQYVYPPPPPPAPLPPIPPPLVAPPPVVYAPAPCCVEAAPPPPPAQPVQTVVVTQPKRPEYRSQFGLGVRVGGGIENTDWNRLGIGGELLFRLTPHLALELGADYQRSVNHQFERTTVPADLGLRVHLSRPHWVVSPYLVGAVTFTWSRQDLIARSEDAYYVGGQVGGGLELRLGRHVALTADARFDGKKRVDASDLGLKSVNGTPVHALTSEYGGLFRFGAAVYF
jgi:hypothetical protein